MEYRGEKNGGEWRVGWDVNASTRRDGSLLPVSGKCMAIVAMFHPPPLPHTFFSPHPWFSPLKSFLSTVNPEKSLLSKFLSLFLARIIIIIIHGVFHFHGLSFTIFSNFLSSFIPSPLPLLSSVFFYF